MEYIDLTRFLLAFFCGYFICLSGTLTQLISNNPLASPSTLGMDGFAVLFVIISQLIITFFGVETDLIGLSMRFFLLFFVLLIIFPSKKTREVWDILEIRNIIILGITFNLFVGAVFTILQFLFLAYNFEFPTGLWFGSLKIYTDSAIYIFVLLFIFVKFFLFTQSQKLQFLNLGRSFATSMGVDIVKTQKRALLLSLFLTGFVINFFGVFSFLGLILPHILRRLKWFRIDMRKEIMYAPYLAGSLIALLDWACYYFTINGAELPVGMVSGILGSFLLIGLSIKSGFRRA